MSQFCRDAIMEKINKEFSADYADQQIKFHMEQVRNWKEKKQNLTGDTDKIKEIIEAGRTQFDVYKEHPEEATGNFKQYLQNTVLHRLKKIGCTKYNVDDIIEYYYGGKKIG